MALGGGWVLEADIEKFFDSVDHTKLREVLSQRVSDGALLRLIGKWLNAGVMEKGVVRHPETGTPQGGVISPLLANVYLHEVLDAATCAMIASTPSLARDARRRSTTIASTCASMSTTAPTKLATSQPFFSVTICLVLVILIVIIARPLCFVRNSTCRLQLRPSGTRSSRR